RPGPDHAYGASMRHGLFLVLCIAVLPACVSPRSAGRADAGTGPAEPAAILRSLNGGLIGRAGLGDLGRADMEKALQAEYRALEYGEAGVPVPWRGSSSLSG